MMLLCFFLASEIYRYRGTLPMRCKSPQEALGRLFSNMTGFSFIMESHVCYLGINFLALLSLSDRSVSPPVLVASPLHHVMM